MASSIFRNLTDEALKQRMNSLRSMGPSSAVFDRMYSTNPRFRAFADSVRGKTPEQAFKENGLDFSAFQNSYA